MKRLLLLFIFVFSSLIHGRKNQDYSHQHNNHYKHEGNGACIGVCFCFHATVIGTHAIYMVMPAEVKVEAKSERNKNPLITLESCDKQLLGQICAKIRSFRKPEPYKGKGVKFVGEVIRRKSGKTAAAK